MDALPPPVQAVVTAPAYVGGALVSLTLVRVAFTVRVG